MADNNTVTKEDLQNSINKAIAELTNVIKVVVDERVSSTETKLTSTETKLTAEMDKRFQSADRQRHAFRKEVENRFHEIRGMTINRFDEAKEYTDAAVVEKIRELKALLDGQAGMASRLDTEQQTLGALYDQLRTDLDATQKSNDGEITDLKHRVTKLEEDVFSSPAEEV
ncbi:MAG: hypothetical protein ACRENG_07160 [bacterium]